MQNELSDLDAQAAALELDIREKGDQIEGLRTEKELQSGGEVRELTAEVDEISKRWGGQPAGAGGGRPTGQGRAGLGGRGSVPGGSVLGSVVLQICLPACLKPRWWQPARCCPLPPALRLACSCMFFALSSPFAPAAPAPSLQRGQGHQHLEQQEGAAGGGACQLRAAGGGAD